jgi:uncharacterized protein YjcR
MREIIENFQTLRNSLSALIDKSGYKNAFIAEKIGMTPNHFYVRKQRGTWSEEEIEKILDVIENDELEDFFLGQLMERMNKEETITFGELKKEMEWK